MIDVLLANAFYLANDTKQREEKFKPYPPLATLYAASILRDMGLEVDLFDATLEPDDRAFAGRLQEQRPKLLIVYEDSFNFLSKMCLSHVRDATIRMIETARAHEIPAAVSSADASDNPAAYLASGADCVMLGEADNTVRELARRLLLDDPGSVGAIPGLAFYDQEQPHRLTRTGPRSTERKLDQIPFPAWDLVDIERYRSVWKRSHGLFSLNMATTRGCPYLCTWCAKPIWGRSYAVRSPANVAEELASIKTRFAPDHIWFADDIFGLKPGWVEQYAVEIRRRDALVPFQIQSRADLMSPAVVASLAEAGCAEVWLGAESGSQHVLDAMKKGITVAQIHRARELLGERGIRTGFFIQFGYPGESLDDIEATLELVRTTLPDAIGISVSYPLPGTEFYDVVRSQLHAKTHWQESNDLEIMFNGTFSSDFYRCLRDHLHRDLDARLAARTAQTPDVLSALDADWRRLRLAEQHVQTPMPVRLGALAR